MAYMRTAKQELNYASKVYKKLVAPLEDALAVANVCGFPDEHIHMLEYMIELARSVEAFKELNIPPRKVGRRSIEEGTLQDQCREIFRALTPRYIQARKRAKDGTDVHGNVLPQQGLIFNFDK
ncbi:hypothetical protein ACIPZ5_17760 [Pseudomonas sp. NPDC089428]|uniref:hypothetical protein n=1 Tax=Pseudomonas sp. NPDC089428 TaxID=3364467 RepID=UPI0037F2E6CF